MKNKNLHLIVACDKKGGIGKNGTMPWHFKKDLKFFKSTTIGWGNNAIVMGYNTWKSLPKKPLPMRDNYVLTRNHTKEVPSGNLCSSRESVFDLTKKYDDVFIIGGAQIYEEFKYFIKGYYYVTHILKDYDCDVFFDDSYTINGLCYGSVTNSLLGRKETILTLKENGTNLIIKRYRRVFYNY